MHRFDAVWSTFAAELRNEAPPANEDILLTLRPRLETQMAGSLLASGGEASRVVKWFKDSLRSAGDSGAAVWEALDDPEVQSQTERLIHITIFLGQRVDAFRGWPVVEVWLLLMFVISYLKSVRNDA